MKLSALAETTARYINTTDRHIFLTGKAGTGKTTFLKYIVQHSHKKVVVAAPTGIAAINANGVTLHSLLQLPFGAFIPERVQPPDMNAQITTLSNLFSKSQFNASKRNLIRELELLIIDEVSMLRADMLDCIDHVLRFIRRKNEPFGGLQILFIGDLLQLPPVVKEYEWSILSLYYPNSYFFQARALKENPPLYIELDKIYRQSDEKFIALLNRFREGKQTSADIDFLNSFYKRDTQKLNTEGSIHLTTHNRKADEINRQRLAVLKSEAFVFEAGIKGAYPEHLYPNASKMILKSGAQVMFIKNDPSGEGRFFNGRIGKVSRLNPEEIWVMFEDKMEVQVPLYTWEYKRYSLNKETNEIEGKVLGAFEQYPLKLAWAVTVHKSQGLTFEKAILDLSGAFAQGQIYVALSRLTSLDGLILSSRIPLKEETISEDMKAFSSSKSTLENLKDTLKVDQEGYLLKLISRTFDFSTLANAIEEHFRSFNKQENRSLKQQYHQWTNNLLKEVIAMKNVGDNFIKQVKRIIATETKYLPLFNERVNKATDYFTPILKQLGDRITAHEQGLESKTKLKTYRKELKELEQLCYNKAKDITKVQMFLSHIVENKVLTKQDLEATELSRTRKRDTKLNRKKNKTPTAEISFKMYKEGMGIEKIARERGLVTGTIEGHLCQYVANGELDAMALLPKEKLTRILEEIIDEATRLGEIKEKLGNDFSYPEIKLAMAHYSFKNKK